MPKVLMEVSVDPIGTESTSESDFVVASERVLKHAITQGVEMTYQLGPMSTTIEGELYQMLSLVGQMHEAVFNEGAKRLISTIRIDDRRDKTPSLSHNIDVIEKKLSISKADMC